MTGLFATMIKLYNEKSFTHNYIYGFIYKGLVYMTVTDTSVMPYILKLDKASRGAGMALRFKPSVDQKLFLLSQGSTVLCSKEYFEQIIAESKYNRGEIFEKLVTEKFGQVWTKDNVPFTQDGDLTVDGVAYQIKFEKATFCNEKSLARL